MLRIKGRTDWNEKGSRGRDSHDASGLMISCVPQTANFSCIINNPFDLKVLVLCARDVLADEVRAFGVPDSMRRIPFEFLIDQRLQQVRHCRRRNIKIMPRPAAQFY